MEVEGPAISPFDNLRHGDPIILEPLVGGVKFLKRVRTGWWFARPRLRSSGSKRDAAATADELIE